MSTFVLPVHPFGNSYQDFFMNHSFCESLLTGVILPLFKGKGAKANNKDNNYRGITLFPTLCKIYEMVLLNRLERHAVDEGLFSDMQFGFKDGVGCTFMNLCYEYSIRWRYEFNLIKSNDKSSIVTFGETKRTHCQSIKQRNWVLGNETA